MINTLRAIAINELVKKYDDQPELVHFMRETIDTIVDQANIQIDDLKRLIEQQRKRIDQLNH